MEMTTKHLVIFGGGVLAGYLLMDYLRKQKQQVTPVTEPPVAVVDPKVAQCEASLQQNLMTARIPSDQLEAYKAQFMADCLSGGGGILPGGSTFDESGGGTFGDVGEYGYGQIDKSKIGQPCVVAYEPIYIKGVYGVEQGVLKCQLIA
jgi:hypothetical protein